MTARIATFITRDEAGLRPPRSRSTSIWPGRGGVAGHYGGPAQRIASHAGCRSTWRGWQAYHMDVRGWVDVAYTGAYCDHGYAFAGRGAGVRTAAQGTNDGNDRFYAVVWLGGEGETPTPAALDAFDWWVAELRGHGGAGMAVKPHRYFKSTGCPGDPVAARCAALDGRPVAAAAPVQEDDWMAARTDDEVVALVKRAFHDYAQNDHFAGGATLRGWIAGRLNSKASEALVLLGRLVAEHGEAAADRDAIAATLAALGIDVDTLAETVRETPVVAPDGTLDAETLLDALLDKAAARLAE